MRCQEGTRPARGAAFLPKRSGTVSRAGKAACCIVQFPCERERESIRDRPYVGRRVSYIRQYRYWPYQEKMV